jgi:hypothetical protein
MIARIGEAPGRLVFAGGVAALLPTGKSLRQVRRRALRGIMSFRPSKYKGE